VLPFDIVLVRGISYKTDGAGEPVEAETAIGAMVTQVTRGAGESASRQPDLPAPRISLPQPPIEHTRRYFRESVDLLQEVQGASRGRVSQGPDAVQRIATEQALKN